MKQQMKITIGLATCVVMALSASAQDAELRIQACLEIPGYSVEGVVQVYVDGAFQGESDTNGFLAVAVDPLTPTGRECRVRAVYPGVAGGETMLWVDPDTTNEVEIVMDSYGLAWESELRSDQVMNGVLSSAASGFSFRLTDKAGAPIPISEVVQVWIWEGDAQAEYPPEAFDVDMNGIAVHTNVATWMRDLNRLDKGERGVILEVTATDGDNQYHVGRLPILLGRYAARGRLLPPESVLDLPLGGIEVRAEILDADIELSALSATNGTFVVEGVPSGLIRYSAVFTNGGTVYGVRGYGRGNDKEGVNLYVQEVEAPEVPGPQARRATLLKSAIQPVFVEAGKLGVEKSAVGTITIPADTAQVTLLYMVYTEEYPDTVLKQGRNDDIWCIEVSVAGTLLYEQLRNINSQATLAPFWREDGTTGFISVPLDMSAHTQGKSATVTIRLYATNIGDSLKPTSIRACVLPASDVFKISKIEFLRQKGYPLHHIVSIPRARNHTAKWLTVDYVPASAAITNAMVEIIRDGKVLMKVQEAKPVSGGKARIVKPGQVQVDAAIMTPFTCEINQSNGPPFHTFQYRVTLQGDVLFMGDTVSAMASNVSPTAQALWRKPAFFEPDTTWRYGHRDYGEDDWCAKGTYEWMLANKSMMQRFDDISGEHGRDLRHTSHQQGMDIDMYYFVNLVGEQNGITGGANWTKTCALVRKALDGGSNETTQVTAWVQTHREKLAGLIALESVQKVYVASGNPNPSGLPARWFENLLKTGRFSKGTNTLDLGLAAWNPSGAAKLHYDRSGEHNSHIHIGLDPSKLNNRP